jgi:hypothetical protein
MAGVAGLRCYGVAGNSDVRVGPCYFLYGGVNKVNLVHFSYGHRKPGVGALGSMIR